MSNLVHVKKIEMVRIENLSPLHVLSLSTCRFLSDVIFSEIDIEELVGVTVEDSYENNQKVYTTTATFSTRSKEPITERRVAFRLTSIDGTRFMIGTNGRPFPIIKEKNPYPEKPADSSLKSVVITWKSVMPMLRIIE